MDLLADIIGFIKDETGLHLSTDMSEKLFRIISRRMNALGIGSPVVYLNLLRNEPDNPEYKNIIEILTVGETYFFRNQEHWNAFRNYVLPRVVKTAVAEKRSPRFWSAACASGEEAYTLAITIKEEGLCQCFDSIDIYASDINREFIAKARKGIFAPHSFRGKEDAYNVYFEKTKKSYRIRDEFRRAVTFMELNLAQKTYPPELKSMDVIFCRNSLMYFCPKSVQSVLKRIVNCLGKDGFLFLGHAEGSIAPFDMLKRIGHSNTFFFQNTEARAYRTDFLKPTRKLNSFEKMVAEPDTDQQSIVPDRRQEFSVNADVRDANDKPQILPDKERADAFDHAMDLYCRETYDMALKILTENLQTREGSMNEIILAGMINLNMSRLANARDYCDKALEKSDIKPEGYCLEAMVKEVDSDLKGAIEACLKSIFLDKRFFAPHYRLGQLYQKSGRGQKSRHAFLNALKTLDKDSEERIRLFFGILPKNKLKELCKEKCRNKKQAS